MQETKKKVATLFLWPCITAANSLRNICGRVYMSACKEFLSCSILCEYAPKVYFSHKKNEVARCEMSVDILKPRRDICRLFNIYIYIYL